MVHLKSVQPAHTRVDQRAWQSQKCIYILYLGRPSHFEFTLQNRSSLFNLFSSSSSLSLSEKKKWFIIWIKNILFNIPRGPSRFNSPSKFMNLITCQIQKILQYWYKPPLRLIDYESTIGILIYVLEASSLKGSELFVDPCTEYWAVINIVVLLCMSKGPNIRRVGLCELIPNIQNGLTPFFFFFFFLAQHSHPYNWDVTEAAPVRLIDSRGFDFTFRNGIHSKRLFEQISMLAISIHFSNSLPPSPS